MSKIDIKNYSYSIGLCAKKTLQGHKGVNMNVHRVRFLKYKKKCKTKVSLLYFDPAKNAIPR